METPVRERDADLHRATVGGRLESDLIDREAQVV
jgi:hypothetical protein